MITTFSELDLDPALLSAIADIGYSRPTQIQTEVIPYALDGHDILACSSTGTGKTAAFILPALQHLLDYPRQKARAARVLILTPTRELAIQIADQAKLLAKNTNLNVATIIGGISYQDHANLLAATQDIIIATPGRLMEYIQAQRFDCYAIEWLILDEADRMLDMGFALVVNKLSVECSNRSQTLLFSATLEGCGVAGFSETLLTKPVSIDAISSLRERKKITQWYHRADNADHKFALLKNILQKQATRSIIFVKTRERLALVRSLLQSSNIPCSWIQGEMAQEKRNNAIVRFRDNQVHVLLATDVAARGIDLPDVSHVINYDMPLSADVYLHRIGRTARAGKKGIAISLIEAHDQPMIERVMRYIKEDIKERFIKDLRPQHKKAVFKKKAKNQKGKTNTKNTNNTKSVNKKIKAKKVSSK